MELCTARAISNLPHHKFFTPNLTHIRWKNSLSLKHVSVSRTNRGFLCYANSSLRSTTSEDTSSGGSQYVKEESDVVITMKDAQSVEKAEYIEAEVPKEGPSEDEQNKPFEFINKLNIEFGSEDSYSILLFGGGALVALYLATAIVGAIDSVPLFPKLLEIVGLAYTLWFATRYLLFKENRDELFDKIEEIKQQVIGSNDD